GHTSCKQTSERCCSHKRHRVETHHAAALVFVNNRLKDRVTHGHLDHEAKASQNHQQERQPHHAAKRKHDQACAKRSRRQRNVFAKTQHTPARRKNHRSNQRTDTGSSHQESQSIWSTMQYVVSEHWHQHRVRHTDQTHQSNQQQNVTNRRE